MTNEEALNILYINMSSVNLHGFCSYILNPTANNECIELCKKSLEKQIPKKPLNIEETKYKVSYKCPVCGTLHVNNWCGTEWKLPFCSICGQALDWNAHPTEKGGAE